MNQQTQIAHTPATNHEPSLREWLVKIRDSLGHGGEELREVLRKEFKENNLIEWSRRFDEMFDCWFRHSYRPPEAPEVRATRAAERQALVASGLAQIEIRERQIRMLAKIELISEMMPNGLPLGECTFSQVRDLAGVYGPFLERLAKRGRPRQKVKSVFSEDQLQELWNTSGENNSRK